MSTTKYMKFSTEKEKTINQLLSNIDGKQIEKNINIKQIYNQHKRNNIWMDNLECYWSRWKAVINIRYIVIYRDMLNIYRLCYGADTNSNIPPQLHNRKKVEEMRKKKKKKKKKKVKLTDDEGQQDQASDKI